MVLRVVGRLPAPRKCSYIISMTSYVDRRPTGSARGKSWLSPARPLGRLQPTQNEQFKLVAIPIVPFTIDVSELHITTEATVSR